MGLSGGMDLMVLDIMLPRLDGFDVIRNLRAAKQMLPTLILSARDAVGDIVRGLDFGADDYLVRAFRSGRNAGACCASYLARSGPVRFRSAVRGSGVV